MAPRKPPDKAAIARKRAGLSIAEAAKKARITPEYLRRVELHGAPYSLARRLAGLYGCGIEVFLPRPKTKMSLDNESGE